MRVLHVIARMNIGGTATYLRNLIEGLEAKGVTNLLAVGHVPSNEREDSRLSELNFKRIDSLSRSLNPVLDIRASSELKSTIEEFKPDIIHSHTFKAGLLARSRNSEVPNVHTFHGHHLYDPEFGWFSGSVLNWIERRLARRSERLLTIGEKVGKELLAQGIGSADQYISIPPGIEPLEDVNAASVRKKLGIGKTDFVVVWLGRFTQVKRPDLVVEIAKKIPSITFVMAGDGELQDRIRQAAPGNLRTVGVQSAAEMWGIADLALLTSNSEGMPLSMIEAQMSGVPVVATNVGSVSEIVVDGVTGLLTEVDAGQMASAIFELNSNPLKLKEMSRTAEKRARMLFSQEVMVGKHIKVYQEILDKVAK